MSKRVVCIAWLVLLTAVLILQGCVKANFTEPISQFQASINKSAAAITTYYTELNDNERAWYLNRRLYDPTLHVEGTTRDKDKKIIRTPLYYKVFSPQGIKARTDAIVLIGQYANRLGALAGSDAPTNIGTAIGTLGSNMDKLATTFKGLAEKKEDPTAVKYAGPVSQIVGLFAKQIVEAKREELLKQAIEEGAPAVNKILDLLDYDLAELIQPIRTTGFKEALADSVNAYNDLVDEYKSKPGEKWPLDQRRKMLADIEEAANQYQLAIATDPADLIRGIRQANLALLKYAKSEKSPKNLTELVAALGTFQSQVDILATAINELRSAGGS